MQYIVYSDGGARGNPGPAGCGFVVQDKEGNILHEGSEYIGETTNNQAEYQALWLALEHIKKTSTAHPQPLTLIKCYLDSELVVKQLNKEYKMKNKDLRLWFDKITMLNFEWGGIISFHHVRREKNKHADRLANEAMDGKGR